MISKRLNRFTDRMINLSPRIIKILSLLAVVMLAAYLRLQNVNWDQSQHLHPDERFLTMVTSAMQIPASFSDYFDQSKSLMNPANINFKFYVYGTWPLVLTKIIAVKAGSDEFTALTFLGRILAALSDLSVVLAIYLCVQILGSLCNLFKNAILPLLAAFLYALFVLPIQLSHFYTTDAFFSAFLIWSFYFLLCSLLAKNLFGYWSCIFVSAILFAMALASKISAVFISPLLVVLLIMGVYWQRRSLSNSQILPVSLALFALTAYLGVRIFDPYLFENKSILDFTPSKLFLKNIIELQSYGGPLNTFPPNIQWISKTKFIFPYTNIVFAGLGLPLALIVLSGFIISIAELYKSVRCRVAVAWSLLGKDDLLLMGIIGWIVCFLIYQGAQWSPSMRYFIFVYPFFAIFGSIGLLASVKYILTIKSQRLQKLNTIILFFFIFLWPYMFTAIYEEKHSRVAASEWIWKNIPDGAKIAFEHWDDPLPLQIEGLNNKTFSGTELAIFPPDSSGKWETLTPQLEQAHYYILSSNRAWGTMPLVPSLYPETKQFYADLFSNKYKNYKLIKEFTSYPKLCLPFSNSHCIEFSDQWLEEAFSVYDHPKVLIFKNTTHTL